MKKIYAASIAIALASLVAGSAMADTVEPTTGAATKASSGLTREQVKAEMLAYRASHKSAIIEATTGMNITELIELRRAMNQPADTNRQ